MVLQIQTPNTRRGRRGKNKVRRKIRRRGKRRTRGANTLTKSKAAKRKTTSMTATTRSRLGRTGEAVHVRQRIVSAHVMATFGADETKEQKKRNGSRRGDEKWTFKADKETGRGRETEGGKETGRETLRRRPRGRERSRGTERGIKRTETGTERRGGGDKTIHLSVLKRK